MKNAVAVGSNIVAKVEGTTLTLTIDMSKTLGLSKSGKNELLASTGGNVMIPGTNAKLGLNLFTPPAAK